MDTVFGLPAHPLLVHIPVVLVPLGMAVAVAAVALARLRSVLLAVALGIGVLASVGTFLVQESGEPLEERVEDTRGDSHLLDEHTEQGERVLPFVIGFVVLAGAATYVSRGDRYRAAVIPLAVLTLLAGGASTAQVVRVGHSGARAAWDDVADD